MDLVAIIGIIYFIGLPIMPILIRVIPGLNESLHKNINTSNPAIVSTILWPIVFIYLFIYHTSKFFIATINWVSGNGFVTKTNEDYIRGGLQ